ncbi:MAG: ribonuclease E/G [Emcibacter sp.]|nr:ribonuclease E/G [Emcibacter sp.]
MTIKMLIDATHEEETRVAIVHGNRVEEFDYESSAKKQIKGNVYLAKVTRVEPSLQAAFVEYGGNRQGFLAFSEIHPDYYQIPVSDREKLIAEEKAAYASLLAEEDDVIEKKPNRRPHKKDNKRSQKPSVTSDAPSDGENRDNIEEHEAAKLSTDIMPSEDVSEAKETVTTKAETVREPENITEEVVSEINIHDEHDENDINGSQITDDEEAEEKLRIKIAKGLRHKYKIQEVIKKNQVLLIQVVKEERGNKGAALTTYLSLPGRYCVLMPNTLHGGGVSRKIAGMGERKSLKKILSDLKMPSGIGCIIRTAGQSRTKTEIKRDFDYLIRTWEGIKERTLKSIAPVLINEEGDLIKRSIRDLYTREVDEILVEGENGYKTARSFMRLLMPSHARKIKQYTESIPLLQKYQVESQLDSMFSPIVQLKSGGYIVINPTEALVSIDVNSGKATKEHNIEETARKTNLEAAEEVARQLRLRDMAGLIVIDFIDMEIRANNRAVEQKLKDCLASDRARIQVGKISSFGLMEMSRQRLRSGMLESSTRICPHCEGSGVIRSVETQILHILRELEEEGSKARSKKISLHLPENMAIYLLNNKRAKLVSMEEQYDYTILIVIDKSLTESAYKIELPFTPQKNEEKQNNIKPTRPASLEQQDTTIQNRNNRDQSTGSKRNRNRNQDRPNRAKYQDKPIEGAEVQENTPAAEAGSVQETPPSVNPEGKSKRRRRRPRRGNKFQSENAVSVNTEQSTPSPDTVKVTEAAVELTSQEPVENTDHKPEADNTDAPKRRKRVRNTRKKSEDKPEDTIEAQATDVKSEADVSKKDASSEITPETKNETKNETKTETKTEKKPTRRPYPPQTRARRKAVDSKVADATNDTNKTTPSPVKSESATAKKTKSTPKSEPKTDGKNPVEPNNNGPKRTGWWQRTFG